MIERGYEPDDWLGIAVAGLFYYDFTEEQKIDQMCDSLLQKVRGTLNDEGQTSGNASASPNQEADGEPEHNDKAQPKVEEKAIIWSFTQHLKYGTETVRYTLIHFAQLAMWVFDVLKV